MSLILPKYQPENESLSEYYYRQLINFWETRFSLYKTFHKNASPDLISQIEDYEGLFKKLYLQSKEDNFFWEYCPLEVYKSTFIQRKSKYLVDLNNEPDEIDFIERELKVLKSINIHLNVCTSDPYLYISIPFVTEIFDIINCDDQIILFDENLAKSIELGTNKKIDFLEVKKKENEGILSQENPHPKIFMNLKSYELFRYLIEYIGQKKSDIAWIYRAMLHDNFIHQQSESAFRKWLFDEKIINLEKKIPQLDHYKKAERQKMYLESLKHFNLKSKTFS